MTGIKHMGIQIVIIDTIRINDTSNKLFAILSVVVIVAEQYHSLTQQEYGCLEDFKEITVKATEKILIG